jgi:outer membrane protein assembly factor BamE (lipoprotein component of BamABCDE complex)
MHVNWTRWPSGAAVLAGLSIVVSGCASYPSNIAPGMTKSQVIDRFGKPAADSTSDAGEVLVYSTAPMGDRAFAAFLDASGTVTGVQQVLTLAHFGKIVPGVWTRDSVLDNFGIPAERRNIRGNLVWDYRYRELDVYHSLFTVTFDDQGVVLKAENGPDPMFDGGHDSGRK